MRFLHERVRAARLAAGITQAGLAYACQTTEKTIRRIENGSDGANGPGLFLTARLARALGLTLNDLVDWEDEA